MLKLEYIYGGYTKNQFILNGLDLTILSGETLAVIGQNGAGKSTLAKAILGMLPYCAGEITFNGENISGKSTAQIMRRGIGFFMQGGRIFPHLSVYENLVFAGRRQTRKDFDKNVNKLKQYFELIANEKKYSQEASYLSGGEKHQLAMGMVLINCPKFLILDEPSAGLSPQNTEKIYNILRNIREKEKVTILLIEQNVEKAVLFSNRVALLRTGLIEKTLDVNQTTVFKEIDEFYFE